MIRLVVAAGLFLVATACSSGQPVTTTTAALIRVTERDFHISAPTRLSSGNIVLSVHNMGPDAHELIVVRSDGSIPLRKDGITVDEEELGRDIAGILEPGLPGAVRTLRLHLIPGRYVFICNMFGHYMGGMHHVLLVH